MARDDAKLFKQELLEGIRLESQGSTHGDIMRLRSDKTVARNYMTFTFMSQERHECESHAVRPGVLSRLGWLASGLTGAVGLVGQGDRGPLRGSRFKRPRVLVLRDAPLPRSMSGKILKRELRSELRGSELKTSGS